ncbi:protein HOTHEAD-like [Cryptomeria japonica]|uniref:protein HOTHEAD-like n=1 Tax=Cryptomeria japonica TaxID=3369 RepID=UPI0025AD4F33|nr:protein HOTHEAD-like [Cryptomeria japonica]
MRVEFKFEYPYPFMTFDAAKAAARSYDYIVVGGGAAGCPLAATLSQHYSVLLLERGDSPYGNPDVEDFRAFFKLLGGPKNYPDVAQGFVSEDGMQLVRGRVLGGGTAINAGFYSRASSEYIGKMKWDKKLVNESYEWVEKLNVFKPEKLSTINSAIKDGLIEAGILPYNGYSLEHLEGTKIGASIFDKNGKRHTAADLLQYANPHNIVVLLNATASKVLFKKASGKPKAIGVNITSGIDGLHIQVLLNKLSTKNEVILSAGTLGSTQLLLLSGIGPVQQLKKLNIPIVLDLPSIGKNVQDNPIVNFIIESSKPLEFATTQVVGILDDSNLYIEPLSFPQQNNATNTQYLGFVADNGHSKILRFLGTALPKNISNDDSLAKFCKDTLSTIFHYHGGCQVDLVVDKRYQVKGVDNLRVVDGSIYKDSPGTNPQATTMMLGRYMGVNIIQGRMKT